MIATELFITLLTLIVFLVDHHHHFVSLVQVQDVALTLGLL